MHVDTTDCTIGYASPILLESSPRRLGQTGLLVSRYFVRLDSYLLALGQQDCALFDDDGASRYAPSFRP